MKSYVNTLADYREAPFEKNVTISCPAEYIESQLRHLTRDYKKTEAVDVVENGDVVILALKSELEKFNRPMLPLTVGKNLFDEELEAQLVGHSVGEEFTVKVQNKDVAVAIKQASRTVFPQPTDEMALAYAKEHDDFADVKTVEDYRNQIVDKYIEEEKMDVIYGTLHEIALYVLNNSDWEFDEEEVHQLVEDEKKYIEQDLQQEESKSINDLTKEDLKRFFDVSTFDEFEEFIKNAAEERIATVLLFADVYGVDAKKMSVQELENSEFFNWDFLENYIKESIKITEEK